MRKEVTITITDNNIEHQFRIRQMSATETQEWLIKALGILAGGVGLVGATEDTVMKAISDKGLAVLSNLDYDKAKPLIGKLISCCSKVDGKAVMQCSLENIDSILDEVKSLTALEVEALKLNFPDFFQKGVEENHSQDERKIKLPPRR